MLCGGFYMKIIDGHIHILVGSGGDYADSYQLLNTYSETDY